MKFNRHRRLRSSQNIRNLVKDLYLDISDFVQPLFIEEGENIKTEIESMPGQFRFSLDTLDKELENIWNLGIRSVILFGIPKEKDPKGRGAYDENGIIQKAIKKIKESHPEMVVITDVCMCEYTSHGHCGILEGTNLHNDKTLEYLAKVALSHARAGADIVAPSDMMDGRIITIREALDGEGFINLPIMSYSVKYSSAFYGPFREAADSAPTFGDRKTYQMDFRNSKEAILEARDDINEGADIIMVKPALAYLDVIKALSTKFDVPIAAYNVSGEYTMIKAGSKLGWIDEKQIVMEKMYALKRAGATIIITYHTKDLAKWIEEERNSN